MSFNRIFTDIALAQGVEIGSPEWTKGGLHAFSGNTGGHPAYGWRRPEAMTDDRVRAVLANYCARGVFYDRLQYPLIESGYNLGGRPKGWAPEDASDLPGGERAYLTSQGMVKVSGPDVQHFWIDPLFDVIDRADGIMVQIHTGRMVPAKIVAYVVAQLLVDSMTGMIRLHGRYWGGGRTALRVIDTFVQAGKRELVRDENVAVFFAWLETYGLPFFEKPPAIVDAKRQGQCNLFQEIGWMLPVVYDAERALQGVRPDLAARFKAIRQRLSQWMLDIEEIAGGLSAWSFMQFTPAIRAGEDGKPLPTLKGAITAEDILGPKWYLNWSVTAADVARRTIPGAASEKLFADMVAEVKRGKSYLNPDMKPFLVDADREWIQFE